MSKTTSSIQMAESELCQWDGRTSWLYRH